MIRETRLYKIEVFGTEIKPGVPHPTVFADQLVFSSIKNPQIVYSFSFQQHLTNSEATSLYFIIYSDTAWWIITTSLNGITAAQTYPLVSGFKRFFNIRPTNQYLIKAAGLYDASGFRIVRKQAGDFLAYFEASEIASQKNRKYGMLLYKPQQITDEQILFNTGENPSFDRFALNLGARVYLSERFSGYAGGLDLKGRTGDLLYRQIEDLQLAAHVGPWLKHVASDEQQVEKKRHIGNDNLVVLYQQCGCEFDPTEFKSQMIYCWIVVQEATTGDEMLELDRQGKCRFKVKVVYRKFVTLAGQSIPKQLENGDEMLKDEFYKWLTSKILDVMYGFYETGDLQMKMQRHRQSMVDSFLK